MGGSGVLLHCAMRPPLLNQGGRGADSGTTELLSREVLSWGCRGGSAGPARPEVLTHMLSREVLSRATQVTPEPGCFGSLGDVEFHAQ